MARTSVSVTIRRLIGICIALACFAEFWRGLAFILGPDIRLDLGSINFPTKRLAVAWNLYALWGIGAWVGINLTVGDLFKRVADGASASKAGWFYALAVCVGLSFLIACAMRLFVLQGVPLTDDETSYYLASETLSVGRLFGDAPSLPEFFDRGFLVIEAGRMYSQYFIGWPVLLAMASFLHLEYWLSALLGALSAVPLAAILKRHVAPPIAIAGVVVYSTSMMVGVMGALLLTHAASTLFALLFAAWYFRLKAGEISGSLAGLMGATIFSAAFFIRPSTTLVVCGPFLIASSFYLLRHWRKNGATIFGFGLAASIFASLFLWVNRFLYGSWFATGYAPVRAAAEAVSGNPLRDLGLSDRVTMVLNDPSLLVSLLQSGIARLSYDFLGLPAVSILLLLLLVLARPGIRIFAASVVLSLILHALIMDFGIDTFGPVHLFELGPCLIVLLCGAADSLPALRIKAEKYLSPRAVSYWPTAGSLAAGLMCLILVSWPTYFSLRVLNLVPIRENIAAPLRAAEMLEGRSVVFTPRGILTNQAPIQPLRHFLFYKPVNDYGLNGKTLWVNDLGMEKNEEFMRTRPDRNGYLLRWTSEGHPVLIKLDSAKRVEP